MDRAAASAWIEAYERAWRSPGVEGISEIFSPEAVYSPGPFEEPVAGLGAIGVFWERERRSAEEEFSLDAELIAVEGDTAVAQVEVAYGDPRPQLYRDLWVMRFDEGGRCRSFEEWPFWPPGTRGAVAGAGAT